MLPFVRIFMYKPMQRRIIHRQKEPDLHWNLEKIKK
jgi:hypothetical protein